MISYVNLWSLTSNHIYHEVEDWFIKFEGEEGLEFNVQYYLTILDIDNRILEKSIPFIVLNLNDHSSIQNLVHRLNSYSYLSMVVVYVHNKSFISDFESKFLTKFFKDHIYVVRRPFYLLYYTRALLILYIIRLFLKYKLWM